jgi:hypothetical protein
MTLCDGAVPVLLAASLVAPLFAIWVVFDYRRAMQRWQPVTAESNSG